MKVEWSYEAQCEFNDFLNYYKVNAGLPYAQKFSKMIRDEVRREDTILGKHGFRALFIRQYACIYKIEEDTVFVYHLADARRNYLYNIFGLA